MKTKFKLSLTHAAAIMLLVAFAALALGSIESSPDFYDSGTPRVTVPDYSGTYFIATRGGLVFELSGGNVENGTKIVQWAYHGGENQQFRFERQSDGTYSIQAAGGRYLHIENSSTDDGASIVLWDGFGSANTRYNIERHDANHVSITSVHSGKHITVPMHENNNISILGDTLNQWNAGTNVNQRTFSLVPVNNRNSLIPVQNGTYAIQASLGRYLYIQSNRTDNGAPIVLWEGVGAANSLYTIERQPDGTYMIKSNHSNRVFDVAGRSTTNGAAVHQWDWSNLSNQKWYIIKVNDDFYKLINQNSWKALDVPNNRNENGLGLIQHDDNGNAAQQFRLIRR